MAEPQGEPTKACPTCQSSGRFAVGKGCAKCGNNVFTCSHDGFGDCEACGASAGPFNTPQKAPVINKILDSVAKAMSGKERKVGDCAACGKEAKDFRNDLSRQEYAISMLCQDCQDEVFGA